MSWWDNDDTITDAERNAREWQRQSAMLRRREELPWQQYARDAETAQNKEMWDLTQGHKPAYQYSWNETATQKGIPIGKVPQAIRTGYRDDAGNHVEPPAQLSELLPDVPGGDSGMFREARNIDLYMNQPMFKQGDDGSGRLRTEQDPAASSLAPDYFRNLIDYIGGAHWGGFKSWDEVGSDPELQQSAMSLGTGASSIGPRLVGAPIKDLLMRALQRLFYGKPGVAEPQTPQLPGNPPLELPPSAGTDFLRPWTTRPRQIPEVTQPRQWNLPDITRGNTDPMTGVATRYAPPQLPSGRPAPVQIPQLPNFVLRPPSEPNPMTTNLPTWSPTNPAPPSLTQLPKTGIPDWFGEMQFPSRPNFPETYRYLDEWRRFKAAMGGNRPEPQIPTPQALKEFLMLKRSLGQLGQ